MKKYFEQLRPMERRLVVGVIVIFVVVLNAVYIWPRFSDWSNLQGRMAKARSELARNQAGTAQIPELQAKVKTFAAEGEYVAPEDQAINLMRTIQAQAAACGFSVNYSPGRMRTNDQFFVEQVQNILVVAQEEQLVDFLYKLGSGASMIRVRDLTLSPDPPRQRLSADIKLVASYQKTPASAPAAKTSTAKAK